MRVDMATVIMPDGALRPTCVHCSTLLLRKGMLRVKSGGLVGIKQNVGYVVYEIVEPNTTETLRAAVAGEHKGGRPWPD
jgi:hypothetical protein